MDQLKGVAHKFLLKTNLLKQCFTNIITRYVLLDKQYFDNVSSENYMIFKA